MPARDPYRPVTIAHVSDLHLGAHCPVAADELAVDVATADPTATIVTGDCTMRARPEQFRLARALLDRLPRPLLVVIGNHDVPLGDVWSRLTSPYGRYRYSLGAELDPVLDLDGLRVQGLGSAPPWRWKSGRVTRRQTDRLVEVLSAAPPTAVRVVALHHPLSQHGAAGLVGRARLLDALARARVDLVLAGHTHVPTTRRTVLPSVAGQGRQVVIEVVAGTATSTRTRSAGRSWTLIRVDAEEVTVEHRYHRDAGWHGARPTRFPRHDPAADRR